MRSSLDNEDFEHYLQQQVKSHRIYPSDQLWRNIQEQLHEKGRWPALTFISILIIALLVIGTLVLPPTDRLVQNVHRRIYNDSLATAAANTANAVRKAPLLEESLATERITQHTITAAAEKIAQEYIAANQSVTIAIVPQTNALRMTDTVSRSGILLSGNAKTVIPVVRKAETVSALLTPEAMATLPASTGSSVATKEKTIDSNSTVLQPFSMRYSTPATSKEQALQQQLLKNLDIAPPAPQVSLKHKGPARYELQWYVAPSASYRRLINEKTSKSTQNFLPTPIASNYSIDINQVVRHKPAAGFEIGASFGYRLNHQLTLKTGLQYNLRQYNIQAYAYYLEPTAIALNGSRPDTLNSYSQYRNMNLGGSEPITLHNRYHEISIPLGIDWKGWATKKLAWGISAFVQPTYIFDRDPFIITTDFKNYTDGSSLMRNWNINTSFETYVSYRVGGMRLQLGPQFRYQQFPTFKNKYPIKEYLLDYGIKFSITQPLP